MTISTTAPTTPLAVVQALRDHLDADGWTINHNAASVQSYYASATPTSGHRVHATRSGLTVGLYGWAGNCCPWPVPNNLSRPASVGLSCSTGYDAGANWDDQPGAPEQAQYRFGALARDIAAGGTLRVYSWAADPANVAAVLETAGGDFKWLLWGLLDPVGVAVGGQFFAGSDSWKTTTGTGPLMHQEYSADDQCGYVRTTDWCAGKGPVLPSLRCVLPLAGRYDSSYPAPLTALTEAGCDGGTGIAPLWPLPVLAETGLSTGYFHPLGHLPNLRYVDMTYLSPGQEITLDGDVWVCWPLISSADPRGLAVLKEA